MTRQKKTIEKQQATSKEAIVGSLVGWLVEPDAGDSIRVDFPGNDHGPLPARSTIPLDERKTDQREVVLIFDRGDPKRPIIIGLLQSTVRTPNLDLILDRKREEQNVESEPGSVDREAPVEAVVDGKSVQIEGQDEVVLRCGKASIILKRNGKVIIHGVQIESRAKGTNRIKGGVVQVN